MTHRYIANKVASDRGPNIYRLVGPAADTEKGVPHPRFGWPDQVVVLLLSDHHYRPVIELTASSLHPGRFLTNAIGITVEEIT